MHCSSLCVISQSELLLLAKKKAVTNPIITEFVEKHVTHASREQTEQDRNQNLYV